MQDPATIALAAAINEKLGAVGTTVSYFDGAASGEARATRAARRRP
jgi:hypothetical protein